MVDAPDNPTASVTPTPRAAPAMTQPAMVLPSVDLNSLLRQAMPTGNTGFIQPTINRLRDIQTAKNAELDPMRQQFKDTYAADKSDVDTRYNAVEPVDIKPWTQKRPENDPIRTFGSLGSVFAQIASAFTNQPMVNALNGSAAAMKAVRDNDLAGYTDAFNTWKENTGLALKRHEVQRQDYQAAMDKMKTDMTAGQAMLTTAAAKYGDDAAQVLQSAGLYKELNDVLESRQKAAAGLLQVYPQLEQLGLQQKLLMSDPDWASGDPDRMRQAYQKVKVAMSPYSLAQSDPKRIALQKFLQENPNATSEDIAKFNRSQTASGAASPLSEAALTQMAEQYLAGDKSALQGLGFGSVGAQNRAAVREKIAALAKERGLTGDDLAKLNAEYEGLKAGERSLGTRTAQIGMPVNEAKNLIPLALEASDAFGRSGFVPLNEAYQRYARGIGDERIARFVAANNALINVYARAISPIGAPTVSDKEHAREVLETAMTPDQYRAVVQQLQAEMEAAQLAPGQVREEFRGYGLNKPHEKPNANPASNGWSVRKIP